MEKSLNLHVQINMYFTFTKFTNTLFTKYSSETSSDFSVKN